MNSLEALKNELILQKQCIEKNGGVVAVAGNNPSPAEITAGIKTLAAVDFELATAEEGDVKQGKTFYAKNNVLKTGNAIVDPDAINKTFMPNTTSPSDEDVYYAFPDYVTIVRNYCFDSNKNKVHITFTPYITEIRERAFYGTTNFVFENLHEATGLTRLSQYAFSNSSGQGIDFENLPPNLSYFDAFSFHNCIPEGSSLVFPEAMTYYGQSIFRCDSRRYLNEITINAPGIKEIGNYMFYNLIFRNDFKMSSNIKELLSYCCYNGSYKNVIIHSGITRLYNYCFGADSSAPTEGLNIQSVVFEAEVPPTIGSSPFATQHVNNGLKIYVPDNSVEEYKAVVNLQKYASIIFPISERE